MTALALILTALIACTAVGCLAAITLRSRTMPGPSLVGRTIVVHPNDPDQPSVRGILHGQYSDRLTLVQGIYLHASGDAPVDIVHIPTGAYSSFQELAPQAIETPA